MAGFGASLHNNGSKGNLNDFNMTNAGGAFQSIPREARMVRNGSKLNTKLNNSGSNYMIPTITLHNQSFLSK